MRITTNRLRNAFRLVKLVIRQSGHTARNYNSVRQGTQPGTLFFHRELAWLFGREDSWLYGTAGEYRDSVRTGRRLSGLSSPSRKTDGCARSLDVAEGFAGWALVKHVRPRVVVELDTQYGASARLWKDALLRYVPDHELILIDIKDSRRFIGDHEARFIERDVREILPDIFASKRVDVVFNDAHPYSLIKSSVLDGMHHGVPVFAFHDVGRRHSRSAFNPHSAEASLEKKLKEDDPDYKMCGTWQRHVMAEIFDSRLLSEDSLCAGSYTIQFFDSLFGFGVALHNSLRRIPAPVQAAPRTRGIAPG